MCHQADSSHACQGPTALHMVRLFCSCAAVRVHLLPSTSRAVQGWNKKWDEWVEAPGLVKYDSKLVRADDDKKEGEGGASKKRRTAGGASAAGGDSVGPLPEASRCSTVSTASYDAALMFRALMDCGGPAFEWCACVDAAHALPQRRIA